MHILLTPSSYPSKDHPVRGIFFREQAQALKKAGYKVGVILPQSKHYKLLLKEVYPSLNKITYENDDGIPIYRQYSWAWSRFPSWNNYFLFKTCDNLFKKYIQKHGKPDIIHAHCAWFGGVLGSYLKNKYSIPLVITEHSSIYARELIDLWQFKIVKKAYINADICIVVSPNLGKTLESYFTAAIQPWFWIPNLVQNCFQPASFNYNKNKSNCFCFLNIALMNENKGQADLLRAFAEQFQDDEKVQLRIGGDGVIFNDLKNLAQELGIIKQVIFLGLLSRKQVLEEMQAADVFVLSSHHETFGIVLIEALACGKPVIATACGGPECIVNQNNGLLVPSKNPHELGKAMAKIRNNINNFNSDLIYQDCMTRFSEKAVIGKLTELYNQLFESAK